MSKIYQALEKAERERKREREFQEVQVLTPPPPPEKEPEKQDHPVEIRAIEEMGLPRDLIAVSQPGSLVAEQFRKLRTQLRKLKRPDTPYIFMVTSAMGGEGKTFVSANLAAGIAVDLNTQALLIDSDLRNSSMCEWFGVPGEKGLSDYLAGTGSLKEYILKTSLDKLIVVPSGKQPDNPTELIGSKRMEALIHDLRSEQSNRYVIFDATPVLATAEPEVLGRYVDGIVFVVRAGMIPRETIQQAIRSFDREKIIGIVLNDLDFKTSALHSRYFGSDGYYYHYHYGYGKSKKENNHKPLWKKLLHKKTTQQ